MGILGSKFAFEFDARSPPHSRAERSILREANDGGGSSINVARWNEKPSIPSQTTARQPGTLVVMIALALAAASDRVRGSPSPPHDNRIALTSLLAQTVAGLEVYPCQAIPGSQLHACKSSSVYEDGLANS